MISIVIVEPADDVLVNEGGSLFGFTASSAVSGGAVVCSAGPNSCKMASAGTTQGILGVADSEVAAGNMVSVHGVGSIVRCCASGTFTYGSILYPVAQGKVDDYGTWGTNEPCGVALENSTSDASAIRVLLK